MTETATLPEPFRSLHLALTEATRIADEHKAAVDALMDREDNGEAINDDEFYAAKDLWDGAERNRAIIQRAFVDLRTPRVHTDEDLGDAQHML